MKKKAVINVPIETHALVPVGKKELVLEGDPEKQLEFAQKAAKALMSVVNQKPKKVIIGGKTYIEYGDWQTLARFFGSTVGVEWTKPYEEEGKKIGWEARAIVYRDGQVISSAEAMCTIKDKNWGSRDDFQRRSMAQTRASSKALRNAFGWVAELAGYSSTPAEEMDSYDQTPIKADAVPTVTYDNSEDINDIVPSKPKVSRANNPVDSYLVQKKEIKDLVDKIVMVPLEGGDAYKTWVKEQTGLPLEASNYPEIIVRLKTLA